MFDGEHVPLATLPGMAERTLTISSIGKTFCVTGWKIGWACGPAELVAAVRGAKQFMTFAGGTPLQHAAAVALGMAEEHGARAGAPTLRGQARPPLRRARARRLRGAAPGRAPTSSTPTCAARRDDGVAFCRELPERAGVVAIPTSVFCDDPERGRTLVRFAFCKREEVSTRPRGGSPRCAELTSAPVPRVELSHPEKVLFPADGITKGGPRPVLRGGRARDAPARPRRPLNLWRWNAGIERQRVVQQEIPRARPSGCTASACRAARAATSPTRWPTTPTRSAG